MNLLKKKIKKIKWLYAIYYRLHGHQKEINEVKKKKIELQANGKNLLTEVQRVLEGKGIQVFADFGTLLGIVRDGFFMKWDWDLDFGVINISEKSDTEMWKDIEMALGSIGLKKIKACYYDKEVIEETYTNGVLTIDFFLHFQTDENDNVFLAFKKKGFNYDMDNKYHVTHLKMFKFEKIDKYPFGEIEVSVPHEPEAYLASVYTENWRIPDPNWVSEKGPAWNEIENKFIYAEFWE